MLNFIRFALIGFMILTVAGCTTTHATKDFSVITGEFHFVCKSSPMQTSFERSDILTAAQIVAKAYADAQSKSGSDAPPQDSRLANALKLIKNPIKSAYAAGKPTQNFSSGKTDGTVIEQVVILIKECESFEAH